MKLRTSSSKSAIIRKDIARFAPLWILYLVGLLLMMLTAIGRQTPYYIGRSLDGSLQFLLWINMIFGALSAQLLFGDLFQTRLCNALHAMPVTRKAWFQCHVVSGLLFSLVPNLITVGILMPQLGEIWYLGFLWLGGMSLQYLFFFGLAVFSVFCTGNRFAMAAVYGILNAASMLAYAFISTIYEPQMYGVSIPMEPFQQLCPLAWLTQGGNYFTIDKINYAVKLDQYQWSYLLVLGGLGILLLLLSLLMYRKRALECAGNFVAVSPLRPVMVLVITLTVGVVLALFGTIFEDSYPVFLGVGLTVGYFAAQMLIRRTIRVFRWKQIAGWILILLAVYGSIGITKLDPLGIVSYVPEADQVKSVSINRHYSSLPEAYTDQETIEMAIRLHQAILDDPQDDRYTNFTLTYTLKNGQKVKRTYHLDEHGEEGDILRKHFSGFKYVMGTEDIEQLKNTVCGFVFEHKYESAVPKAALQELIEAIRLDCEYGNLSQEWGVNYAGEFELIFGELESPYKIISVRYYSESQHIYAWIEKYKDFLMPSREPGK